MAGGPAKAALRARRLRLESVQIFSGNPRAFFSKPIPQAEADQWRETIQAAGIDPVVVHAPYPMNPASPEPENWNRSLKMLLAEMDRCRLLGGRYLVFHPGAHLKSSPEEGIGRVAEAIRRGLDDGPDGVILAVENTSGAGTALGGPLEHLAEIIHRADGGDRVAAWLDTAHAFGFGFDISTPAGVDDWLGEVDRTLGLDRVGGFHINDSKAPVASRKDRHEHLGQGLIGGAGLGRVLAYPGLTGRAGILETPRDSEADEKRDLASARRFRTIGLKKSAGRAG